jgi:hypothetical protein
MDRERFHSNHRMWGGEERQEFEICCLPFEAMPRGNKAITHGTAS